MKRIKRKDGFINIIDVGEECPSGEICFMIDEFAWAQKMAATYSSDPDSLKSFWETLFERKLSVPGYLLTMDFPKSIEKQEIISLPKPIDSVDVAERKAMAVKYSGDIIAMLKGRTNVPIGD